MKAVEEGGQEGKGRRSKCRLGPKMARPVTNLIFHYLPKARPAYLPAKLPEKKKKDGKLNGNRKLNSESGKVIEKYNS